MTEYWARTYDDRRLSGKPDEEEFEDEEFDLEAVLAEAAAEDADEWKPGDERDVTDEEAPT